MSMGTLYGVGVGPGDPELLTLKAVRVIGKAQRIYAASSSKNSYSVSLDIAGPHLRQGATAEVLAFPMTRDQDALRAAWRANAERVLADLRQGLDVACLTLGDPMTYSTFGYLMHAVLDMEPSARIEVVPGVTSYNAASAEAGHVLVESGDGLAVVSGVDGGEELRKAAEWADAVVVLKAYKRFGHIRAVLEELGLAERTLLVSNCGRPGQEVVRDLSTVTGTPPYFSLLLVRVRGNGLAHAFND